MSDPEAMAKGPPVLLVGPASWPPGGLSALRERFSVVRHEPRQGGPIEELGEELVSALDRVGAPRASLVGLSSGAPVTLWVAAHHPRRVERLVVAPAGANPSGEADLPDLPDLAELAAITAPTLVIAGRSGSSVPIASAAKLVESMPAASMVVLSRAVEEEPERFCSAVLDHLAGTAVERGRRARREVLGDAHVDRSEGTSGAFTDPFFDMITRYAWGEVWTRPGLDRRTRSCVTLAILVALGRFDELELHVRGARRNGLGEAEIAEVLLHSAVYCGVPAANAAFAAARRALEGGRNGVAGGGPGQ